ncbi:MAG: hypothetical protein DDT37_01641 [Firmicutes bacterium]|nr:hypothetical protein [candidate division NPL-UPA2 bacterium]
MSLQRTGLNGPFFYGPAGVTATTRTMNVSEVVLTLGKRTVEWLRRGQQWVATKPVASEASLDFKVWDLTGSGIVANLLDSYLRDRRIALFATTELSGNGLDADFYVVQMDRDEGNENLVQYTVKAVPTDEQRVPVWREHTAVITTTAGPTTTTLSP